MRDGSNVVALRAFAMSKAVCSTAFGMVGEASVQGKPSESQDAWARGRYWKGPVLDATDEQTSTIKMRKSTDRRE